MTDPAVTVVMPAFDAAAFIADSVRSVLAQTYRDFELLVVDDASTDDTVRIATEAAGGDRRVHVRSVPHSGPAKARNAAIAAARGAVLAFLDADDLWEPDHLARLVEGLAAHPDRFVYSNATRFGDGPEEPAHFRGYVPATTFRDLYLSPHIPSPGAIAVRTADVRALGGFVEDEACIGSEDRALYLGLCARGVLPVYLPHKGVRYRVHAGQLTRRPVRQLRAKLEVRTRWRDAVDTATGERLVPADEADRFLAEIETDLAYAIVATDRAEAVALYDRARRRDPTIAKRERGIAFEQKLAWRRWFSLPPPDRLPALAGPARLVAIAWAVAVVALFVVVRVAARGSAP